MPRSILNKAGLALLAFFLYFSIQEVRAQDFFLPFDKISAISLERNGIATKTHYSFKPVLIVKDFEVPEDSSKYYYKIGAKLFRDHLIELNRPDFKLHIDPLFNFGYGDQIETNEEDAADLFINTRGFTLSAQIGKSVFVYTDFRENQARFPGYLNDFVDSLDVVPGSGRVKDFKNSGYDYNMASGYVAIRAAEWLSFQFGHHKQFVGFGHRSLLLSDNAFNYPFASYILSFGSGKFQYRYNIALLQDLERLPAGDTPESIFKRKYLSVNNLSYKPHPRVELGLFESAIFRGFRDSVGTDALNPIALNPIPGIQTTVYGDEDQDVNPLLGFTAGWQVIDKLRVYGQFAYGGGESYGYQVGGKLIGIFNRLDMSVEYNDVEAGLYGSSDPLMRLVHYNQPLAHPVGSGFKEVVAGITYYYNRWYASFNYTGYRSKDLVTLEDVGTAYREVDFFDFTGAYIFNPKTNMQIYAGITERTGVANSTSSTNRFWYVGIRTYLNNVYRDF